MNNNILVSVITVTYNSQDTIEEAILSLGSQSYKNYEHIVIDGCSSDRTLEILAKYQDGFSYFLSEPDTGIADAWNKGIKASKGELLVFLNSDDIFSDKVIEIAVNTYLNSDKSSIIYGDCSYFNEYGVSRIIKGSFNDSNINKGYGFGFVHTTCFVPHSIYKNIGLFNESYNIAIDTDFLVRALRNGVNFVKSNHLVYMREGGVSDAYAMKAYFEYLDVLLKNKYITISKLNKLKIIYKLYHPFRKFRKSSHFVYFLRASKHKLVRLLNLFHQLIPSMYLKKKFLFFLDIQLGKQSYVLSGTKFYMYSKFVAGDNVVINRDCLIDNRDNIVIGNNVSIAHCTKIYTGYHNLYSGFFDFKTKPVKIGNDVNIFSNVTVLPGTIIQDGVAVSSGSVVSGILDAGFLYSGNPAVKVKKIEPSTIKYRNDYPYWSAL